MSARTFALLAGLSLSFVATNTDAHSLLMNPPPVINDDGAKSGPCGCYFGAGPEDPNEDTTATACPAGYTTTSLEAGSQLQVTWKETVNHDGKFRVALSTKPINLATRADLDANVLYEANDTNATSGGIVKTTIIVPDTPCTNCVLQLRQFMSGATKPYYYTCAAIDITVPSGSSSSSSGGNASSSGGGMGGAGGSGGSPGTGNTGGVENVIGAGPAPMDAPQISGACGVTIPHGGSSSTLWWTIAGMFVWALRRRKLARS